MTTRQLFVIRFGEDDAKHLERAAHHHREHEGGNPWADIAATAGALLTGRVQPKVAQDPFLLDIAVCISWECLTRFRDDHLFHASEADLQSWIRQNAVPPTEYRDPSAPQRYAEYLGEELDPMFRD